MLLGGEPWVSVMLKDEKISKGSPENLIFYLFFPGVLAK